MVDETPDLRIMFKIEGHGTVHFNQFDHKIFPSMLTDDGLRRMTQKHFFHCLYSIMRSMSNTPDKLDNGYEERRLSRTSTK